MPEMCTDTSLRKPPRLYLIILESDRGNFSLQEGEGIYMEKIIYTLSIASVGAFIGFKLKIPAGAMIGAMFAVGIANIFGFEGELPKNLKLVAQMAIGAILGLSITKSTIIGLKEVILPAFLLVGAMLVFGLVIGFFLTRFTNMDAITAFFSSSPGGLTEMTIIGADMGGDSAKIVTMQLLRLIGTVTFFPILIKILLKYQ